jgi:DNA-binding IclR family transcriptional regulator
VEQDSVTDKYRLGLRLVELGASVLRDLDLVDRARPYLERLASETGETVNLSVLQGAEALFVDKISSQRFLRTVTHVGARFPLHCTGVGKAMMAHLRDDKLEALLASEPLDRHTPATIVDPEKLKVHLNLVRTRGYAIDDEEFIAGVRCVAAPILGPDGYALGAISVAAPSARLSLKRAQDVGAAVREIAQILSGMARLEETGLGKRRR